MHGHVFQACPKPCSLNARIMYLIVKNLSRDTRLYSHTLSGLLDVTSLM